MTQIHTLSSQKNEHPDISEPVDQILVDGILLGKWINDFIDYEGQYLIPTISNHLWFDSDRKYIWSELKSSNGNIQIPILMCSECDLGCLRHLVFVDINTEGDYVHWNKFGVLGQKSQSIELANIEWFENSPSFKFNKLEYDSILLFYKNMLEKRIIFETISNWLLNVGRQFLWRTKKEYLYLSLNIDQSITITLTGSKKKINPFSKWIINSKYKPKYNSIEIDNHQLNLSAEDILNITRNVVNEIIDLYRDQSIINYTSEILIASNNENILTITNKKMAKSKFW